MYPTRQGYTRQLIAILLLAVMCLVHAVKVLHTHANSTASFQSRETMVAQSGHVHETCSICEFHFAKDTLLSGKPLLVIAPVYKAPTYSRLITAINPNRLSFTGNRGPPNA